MSPRQPAVLRDSGDGDLRHYLITTAARLIGERGSAGLSVRDIAREAQVADGVLYNYFEDKDDLLAQALLMHVASVMTAIPAMPPAGTGSLAGNLRRFIETGIDALTQVTPAFAGLLAQPGVLIRFHALVGGDEAFTGRTADPAAPESTDTQGRMAESHRVDAPDTNGAPATNPRSLPEIVTAYLRDEQQIGRIDPAADVDAAAIMLVGAIHGLVLPRVLFSPPGTTPSPQPGLATRLADTILRGIKHDRMTEVG
jgi:AcrR family transcriptional regulator